MIRYRAAILPVLLICSASHVLAQNYPARAIKLVVPSSPGGGSDIVARILAHKLSEQVGQQVVVENRAGAGTIIGNDAVAKSAPDGYTLLMGLSTLAINPSMYATVPYDALRDFAPISQAVSGPNVLILHPSVPARTVKELIALAKAKPGSLTFGSAGMGTSPHLSAELFKTLAHVDMVHVSYKGIAPAVADLLGGHVSLSFSVVPPAIPHVKTGKLRALAVSTAKRSALLPELPTIDEAGVPGYDAVSWYATLAPAGTPQPVVSKLNTEITRQLQAPELRTKLAGLGLEVKTSTPEECAAFMSADWKSWDKIIRALNIKLD